jgi:hypothetical protein
MTFIYILFSLAAFTAIFVATVVPVAKESSAENLSRAMDLDEITKRVYDACPGLGNVRLSFV